jgi:hypothetical protein
VTEPNFPLLKVLRILDPQTLVLGGAGLDKIHEGTDLIVVAVGPKIEEAGGAPVVLPKANLEVTQHAGAYVIARPPLREVEVAASSLASVLAATASTRKVKQREPLTVPENEVSGNPATRVVRLGDSAIRKDDLKNFVAFLVATTP